MRNLQIRTAASVPHIPSHSDFGHPRLAIILTSCKVSDTESHNIRGLNGEPDAGYAQCRKLDCAWFPVRCCGSNVSVPHPGGESMRSARWLACALLCLFLAASMAHGQGVGASGNISGTVTDPSGAAIPRVAITALETDRGIRYASTSDDAGRYQFAGLPPATYDVTAQVSGFQSVVQKGVAVTVGGTATVDFQLKVATAAETVEVSTQPPVVETERGSQSDTLTDRYITDLPIDRRDYLTFTLLMPGVS